MDIVANKKNYDSDAIKFLRTFLNLQTIAQFLMFSVASFMIIWNFFSRSETILNISWAIGLILTFIIRFIYGK